MKSDSRVFQLSADNIPELFFICSPTRFALILNSITSKLKPLCSSDRPFYLGKGVNKREYTLDLLFRLNVRGGDDGDSEAGPLPSVLIADFCGRHVELILNPRYNPLQNGSFLL